MHNKQLAFYQDADYVSKKKVTPFMRLHYNKLIIIACLNSFGRGVSLFVCLLVYSCACLERANYVLEQFYQLHLTAVKARRETETEDLQAVGMNV